MKKLITLILILCAVSVYAQTTYLPNNVKPTKDSTQSLGSYDARWDTVNAKTTRWSWKLTDGAWTSIRFGTNDGQGYSLQNETSDMPILQVDMTTGSLYLYNSGDGEGFSLERNTLLPCKAMNLASSSMPWDTVYANRYMADSLSSFKRNSAQVTAGAGDSIQVVLVGITANSIIVACYAQSVTATDIAPAVVNVQTNKFTIYAANGKKVNYFVAKL